MSSPDSQETRASTGGDDDYFSKDKTAPEVRKEFTDWLEELGAGQYEPKSEDAVQEHEKAKSFARRRLRNYGLQGQTALAISL